LACSSEELCDLAEYQGAGTKAGEGRSSRLHLFGWVSERLQYTQIAVEVVVSSKTGARHGK
jgi:hypothetical protein